MMVVQTKDVINEIPMDDIAKVLVETTQGYVRIIGVNSK